MIQFIKYETMLIYDLKKTEMFTWNWGNYLIGKESAEICEIVNMFPTLCVRHTVGM